MLLIKWSARASVRGWTRLSDFLAELDAFLSGLSATTRQIRKDAEARRRRPFAETVAEGPGL